MMSSSHEGPEGLEQEQPKTTLDYEDPITGKKIKLTRYKGKTGGKNLDEEYDGFYEDDKGNKYFVKKPKKKHELFTELFIGLLLSELKNNGFIEESLHEALICADVIKLGDDYGLIQPCVKFEELFKLIGTGTADNKDRSAPYETVFGKQAYAKILKLGKVRGLTIALLFSLIVGDYSFHSGNIAAIEKETEEKTEEKTLKNIIYLILARLDWGAGLRNYGRLENQNIMEPYEYQGMLNYKKFTKNYIANFASIDGLFNRSIPTKAKELLKGGNSNLALTEKTLEDIILTVLDKIPVDMFTPEDRLFISKYIYMPSFKNAVCGNDDGNKEFAEKMAGIMYERIGFIAALPIKEETEEFGYNSFMGPKSDEVTSASKTEDKNFPSNDLSSSFEIINKENLKESSLSEKDFIELSAEQVEGIPLSENDFVILNVEQQKELKNSEIEFENLISKEVAAEQVKEKKYEHTITLGELLGLKLENNTQNIALKDFAIKQFYTKVENDRDSQTRQFILDFMDRNFKVNGMANLGLTKMEIEDFKRDITEPNEQYEFIIKRLTVLFGGDRDSAEKLFKSHNQFSAGFIPFLLERSLIGEMNSSENPEEGVTITQPSDAVIDVIKKSDGSIGYVIYFEGLPIVEKKFRLRIGTFPGPIEVHCKTKEAEGGWGFELEKIGTNNEEVIDVLRGKMLNEKDIIQKYKKDIEKKRKTPGEMAATSIGRFFENKHRFKCVGIKKSAALEKAQTISNGIVFYSFEDKKTNGYVHAFYPTCDNDQSYCDTISLRHALQIFKESVKTDGKNHRLVLSLATSQLMRQHWADLFIEIDAEGNVSAKLTDSQAIGYLYPVGYINDVVKEIFGVSLKTEYLNQQSALNFTDCCDLCIQNQNYDLNITPKRVQKIDQTILMIHRDVEEKYKPKFKSAERKIPTDTWHVFSADELNIKPETVYLSESLSVDSSFEMMQKSDLNDSSFIKLEQSITESLYQNKNPKDDIWANDRYMEEYNDKKKLSPEEMMELSKKTWEEWEGKADELQKGLHDLKEELERKKLIEEEQRKKQQHEQEEQQRLQDETNKKLEEERILKEKEHEEILKREEEAKRKSDEQHLQLERQRKLEEMQRQQEEEKRKKQQHEQELEAKRLEEQKHLEQQRQQEEEKKREEEKIRKEKEAKKFKVENDSAIKIQKAFRKHKKSRQTKAAVTLQTSIRGIIANKELKNLKLTEQQRKLEEEKIRKEKEKEKKDIVEVVSLFGRPTELDIEPSPVIQESQSSPGFFSRNKGKILGGIIGSILGAISGAIPAALIIAGVIFLPVTFGGSAALIGIGAGIIIGGALIGGSAGVGVGALFDKRRSASIGDGVSDSIKNTHTIVTITMTEEGTGISTKSTPEMPTVEIPGSKPAGGQAPRNVVPNPVPPTFKRFK